MPALLGKVALVTGSSRGIGAAIAQRLAADGATVAVHYAHNREAAAETVGQIETSGGTAFAVRALLGQTGDAAALFAALDSELADRTGSTHLDILVNNAGSVLGGPLATTTAEQLDALLAINVMATFFVTQHAVKRMGTGGRLISVSSAVTTKAWPETLTYAMSKGAVDVMTRTLAKELAAEGITVNAVNPGLVDTDATAAWVHSSPEAEAMVASYSPFNRIGEARDVADVVAFLASDDARWITGQRIDVSGGTNL